MTPQTAAGIALGVALRAQIIATLKAHPGGLSTAKLCAHLPDSGRKKITQLAGKMRDRGLLKSERVPVATSAGERRMGTRWFVADKPKPPRAVASQKEETDGSGVEMEDREWMRYWHPANRAARRLIAAGPP